MRCLLKITTFVFLSSCAVTERTVTGAYTSSLNQKLRLNDDKTFSIVFEVKDSITGIKKGIEKITGKWAFKDSKVSLEVDDKRFKYWECYPLDVAPKALKRPDKCGAFEKYIFFRKDK